MSESLNIEQRKELLLKEFSGLNTWEEKYKHLIEMGKSHEPIDESLKKDENLVKGCQSQVWIFGELSQEGRVIFKADSDALIVKGVVSLLMRVFSDLTPKEILESDVEFIKEIGFDKHLSPSRANGLYSMVKQIKYYAQAYQTLLNQINK